VQLDRGLSAALAVVFFGLSMFFVWRSFYGMRIGVERRKEAPTPSCDRAPTPAPARTTSDVTSRA
jgi:hypothetical protein